MHISSPSREMAVGSVSPETDFSWLGDDFSKMTSLVFRLLVGGLWRVWTKVLKISNMAEWIGDEVPAAKKRKAISDVTSRFAH